MSSHVLCLDTLLTFIAQMMDRVENQVSLAVLCERNIWTDAHLLQAAR